MCYCQSIVSLLSRSLDVSSQEYLKDQMFPSGDDLSHRAVWYRGRIESFPPMTPTCIASDLARTSEQCERSAIGE